MFVPQNKPRFSVASCRKWQKRRERGVFLFDNDQAGYAAKSAPALQELTAGMAMPADGAVT